MSTSPTRTLVIVSDTREVAGVNFAAAGAVSPTLRVNGSASLKVGGTAPHSYDSAVASLSLLSGSTFGGTAPVTAGTVGNLGGATLALGNGSLTLAPGGTGSLATGTGLSVDNGYQLRNAGVVTQNGNAYVQFGSTGLNKVVNTGTWTMRTTADPLNNPSGNPNSFENGAGGTVEIALPATSSTTNLGYLPITNNGTLNVTKGHLATSVGGAGTGTYQLASGTSLDLNAGTLPLAGTQITGPGQLNLNGGTVSTSATANLPTTTFNGGTLAGGGTVTIPSGTTATFPTGAYAIVDGGTTLRNEGAVTSNNSSYLYYGYTGNNKVTNAGTWTFTTTSDPLYNPSGNAASAFTNAPAGTVNISLALAGDTMNLGYLPITNNGTLNVTKGHLATSVGGAGTGTYSSLPAPASTSTPAPSPWPAPRSPAPASSTSTAAPSPPAPPPTCPPPPSTAAPSPAAAPSPSPPEPPPPSPPAPTPSSTAAPPCATKAPSPPTTAATSTTATPATTRSPTPAPGPSPPPPTPSTTPAATPQRLHQRRRRAADRGPGAAARST